MNYRSIAQFLGTLLIALGAFMLIPLATALLYGEGDAVAFLGSAVITVLAGIALRERQRTYELSHRDAFAIVTFGWLAVALFGALPFLFAGTFALDWDGVTNAFFEAMSGVTTTGSTAIDNIELQPHGIILWRSLLQWVGGMGFIVLSIAILPKLAIGGMELFKAEVPDPIPERMKPRIRETALILWKIYIGLSIVLFVVLSLAGMSPFDALVHALSTLATGGFSSRTEGIGAFGSPLIEGLLILFMLLAGMNFTLHYRSLVSRSLRPWWESREFRVYLGILGVSAVLLGASLWAAGEFGVADSLRHALFQVTSIVTTTGLHTADYALWTPFATAIIFLLMFSGAMAGSTSGSVKVLRHMIVVKHITREMLRLIHPRSIRTVTIGERTIDERVISSILGFALLFLVLVAGGTLILSTQGLDLFSAGAAAAASLTNVGPGLGQVGPTASWAFITPLGKLVLSFLMLIGRLEIYSVLLFLLPRTWAPSRLDNRIEE